ncbi:hypothetical protein VTH82DRAFT_3673 [Thermothelomyces myriococcoides]
MKIILSLLTALHFTVAVLGANTGALQPADLAKPQSGKVHERDGAALPSEELWKRRGGGGGGGRGGGGGGGGGGGRGGSSGGGGRGGSGSPSGPVPGRTFGGGNYYGGGANTAYRSGSRSPSGIAPIFLAGGAIAFWPGLWYHGAHVYNYDDEYEFYNVTTRRNESKPVKCGCSPDAYCGCDENRDKDYLDELIGNGSYAALNKTLVDVANVNGRSTILINGTLLEGPANANTAGDGLRGLLYQVGWWPVVATVCAIALTA